MIRDEVVVREVAQTTVVTLTRKVLEEMDIKKGDEMVLNVLSRNSLLVSKKVNDLNPKRLRLEMELLDERRKFAHSQAQAIEQEVSNGHGEMWAWATALQHEAEVNIDILTKRIELFDLTGEDDTEIAIQRLEALSAQE